MDAFPWPRSPARHGQAPGERSSPGSSPAPLGAHPSSEDLLDAAVEYTFPASDPTATGASIRAADAEARGRRPPG